MGGEIGVESMPGDGSTFWFTIRCKLGEPTYGTETDPDSHEIEAIGALRILVAEDNYVNQMLVTALLGKAGHPVEVVGNGVEVVQAVRAAPYDLVLMDVQMPEIDGPAAAKEIRHPRRPGARRHGPNWRAKPRVEPLIRTPFRCSMAKRWISCVVRSGTTFSTRS